MFELVALRWCSGCRAEQAFEVPPCDDGHGTDCPDLACVECGTALVVGVIVGVGPPEPVAVPAAA